MCLLNQECKQAISFSRSVSCQLVNASVQVHASQPGGILIKQYLPSLPSPLPILSLPLPTPPLLLCFPPSAPPPCVSRSMPRSKLTPASLKGSSSLMGSSLPLALRWERCHTTLCCVVLVTVSLCHDCHDQ